MKAQTFSSALHPLTFNFVVFTSVGMKHFHQMVWEQLVKVREEVKGVTQDVRLGIIFHLLKEVYG